MIVNVYIKIFGRVQGVWYRSSTKQKADQIGVKGWVRNTMDGCVEAVFSSEQEKITELINWCKKGPPLSKVDNVEIRIQKTIEDFKDFKIKY